MEGRGEGGKKMPAWWKTNTHTKSGLTVSLFFLKDKQIKLMKCGINNLSVKTIIYRNFVSNQQSYRAYHYDVYRSI